MDDHSGVTHFHWILSSPRPASHSTLPATNPGVPAAQVGVAYKQSLEMRWKPGSHFWNVLLRPSCARTRSALVSEVIDCSKNAQFMEGMINTVDGKNPAPLRMPETYSLWQYQDLFGHRRCCRIFSINCIICIGSTRKGKTQQKNTPPSISAPPNEMLDLCQVPPLGLYSAETFVRRSHYISAQWPASSHANGFTESLLVKCTETI